VTQAQWQAVMGDNPSRFKGDTLPVEQVSWKDVQKFTQFLNAREGDTKYRLPTEAEWEYAARAGTTTAYSFGDDPRQLGEYAWFGENSGTTTHPVGQKKPNPWGLYDMHGNVLEWVQDWYSKNAYKSFMSTAVDPKGPSAGSRRVLRGGSWAYVAGISRLAFRRHDTPGYRYDGLGLRLLREVETQVAVAAPAEQKKGAEVGEALPGYVSRKEYNPPLPLQPGTQLTVEYSGGSADTKYLIVYFVPNSEDLNPGAPGAELAGPNVKPLREAAKAAGKKGAVAIIVPNGVTQAAAIWVAALKDVDPPGHPIPAGVTARLVVHSISR